VDLLNIVRIQNLKLGPTKSLSAPELLLWVTRKEKVMITVYLPEQYDLTL
jgi:hypothetical protein